MENINILGLFSNTTIGFYNDNTYEFQRFLRFFDHVFF